MAITGKTFTINNNMYTLKFGINAMCKFKDLTGKDIVEVFSKMDGTSLDFEVIRTLYLVGLGGNINIDVVGNLMDEIMSEHGVEKLIEIVYEGVAQSLGVKETPATIANSKN